jgi:hypothetical protein
MKISLLGDGAGWVLDQIVSDFARYTTHTVVGLLENPDMIWMVNPWGMERVMHCVLDKMPILLQIHHVNESQIGDYNFEIFNQATACVVPNRITEQVVRNHLTIPIHRIPYWILSKSQLPADPDRVKLLKKKYDFDDGVLVIGSFQKDSNGDTDSPKLCKGPDIFVRIIERINKVRKVKILLAGRGRRYLIRQLNDMKIPYVYLEKYPNIGDLYDCLDWYLITSRTEGGPQAALEASYRKVKLLSTPVGMSPEILHPNCICKDELDFVCKIGNNEDYREYNFGSVVSTCMPGVIVPQYDEYFKSIVANAKG